MKRHLFHSFLFTTIHYFQNTIQNKVLVYKLILTKISSMSDEMSPVKHTAVHYSNKWYCFVGGIAFEFCTICASKIFLHLKFAH